MRINSTLYYVLKDHLGSASVVTDASGTILGENRYYPFGETRVTTGTIFTDRLFTGQREMAGLGIYHYGARFYSPKLGRFLSADSIVPGYANPQNLNRFSYVTNNPLRYIDPSGHKECDEVDAYGNCYGYDDVDIPDPFDPPNPPDDDEPNEPDVFSCDDPALGCVTDVSGTWQDPAVYISFAAGGWASGLFKTTEWGMYYACLRISICARVLAGTTGLTVYRVWGGTSGPAGRSWTPINPTTISNYASRAGLPPGNSGQYLSEGIMYSLDGVRITNASQILTNPGGLLEYFIENPQIQVFVQEVQYLIPVLKK